jgi:hypothetical protein
MSSTLNCALSSEILDLVGKPVATNAKVAAEAVVIAKTFIAKTDQSTP